MKMIMYKRQIGIADIHGMYVLLKKLIEHVIQFNPDEDQLVFLGDYIDRREQSSEVLEYVKTLKIRHPEEIILLKGNHEDLAARALSFPEARAVRDYFGSPMDHWLMNGGQATINSFGNIENCRKELLPFIEGLRLCFETGSHIFVHGGIPRGKTLETATPHELIWSRGLDYDGPDKILVVGHSVQERVMVGRNLIALDTGAYLTGRLSAYDVLNSRVYEASDETEISG